MFLIYKYEISVFLLFSSLYYLILIFIFQFIFPKK